MSNRKMQASIKISIKAKAKLDAEKNKTGKPITRIIDDLLGVSNE